MTSIRTPTVEAALSGCAARAAAGLKMVLVMICLAGQVVHAQDSFLPLSGFVHRTWTARTGAPGGISDFAQTADGMLWVASTAGLFQFDGIRFSEFHGRPGGSLSLDSVYSLYAPPIGGGLWAGLRYGGVVFLRDEEIIEYPPGDVFPHSTVNALAQDGGGAVWAATAAGLLRFGNGRWEPLGAEWGLPPGFAATVFVDRSGTLWVCMKDGLYVLRAGARRFTKEPLNLSSFAVRLGTLADGPDGTLWVADVAKGRRPTRVNGTVLFPETTAVQFDRDGALWFSAGDDVRRLTNAREFADGAAAPSIERFGRDDGLIGDVSTFFKDRDGDIWVGSGEGIDLFVPTSLRIVRPTPAQFAMTRAGDGSMWWSESFDNETGWRIYRFVHDRAVAQADSSDPITCAYTDEDGTPWFGGRSKVWRFDGGQLTPLPASNAVLGLATQALVRGRDGSLWRSVARGGVFRYVNGEWQRNGGLATLPQEAAFTMTGDELGRLWFGYANNRIALLDGSSARILGPADGLDVGNVTAIEAHGSHVWVGGEHGLLRFDGSRFVPVKVPGESPYRNVWGVVETRSGELWAAAGRSLIRLNHSQLAAVLADRMPETPPQGFDYRDGMAGQVQALRPLPALREAETGGYGSR